MAAVPVNATTRDGIADAAATAGDPTNGMTIPNGGKMYFEVNNTGAGANSFEVNVPGNIDGLVPPNRSYSLAAGAKRRYGPWPVGIYGNELSVEAVSAAALEFRAYSL